MNKSELLSVAKPILFNTPMVQAILDNRKTVTRRIVKESALSKFNFDSTGKLLGSFDGCDMYPSTDDAPYHVGDILYVRETWCKTDCFGLQNGYVYKADGAKNDIFKDTGFTPKWHPSIHMPKETARIFLRVTDVSIERLQDITVKGAIKEGMTDIISGDGTEFISVWNSTVKKQELDRYGWNADPWVWVIEFERQEVSE